MNQFSKEISKPLEQIIRISSGTFLTFSPEGMNHFSKEISKSVDQIYRISSGSFSPFTEIRDTDEALRINQARLARDIKKRSGMRLPRRRAQSSNTADSSDGKSVTSSVIPQCLLAPQNLQMLQDPLQLSDIVMFLPGGRPSHCTVEVHANGIRITGRSKFHVDLMFANVRESLLRLECDRMSLPPILLFCLHDPIMVLGEETENIQVCLYDKDSDNIEKDEQTHCRNEELVNFARKVEETHRTCRTYFAMSFPALEEREFYGASSTGESAIYALTGSALVVVKEPPFKVFPLRDIEIVNLTHVQPDEIDMTMVFADFNCGVLEIRSIPSKFLNDIKRRLNFAEVKFYVNESRVKWDVLVRDIAKSPEQFRNSGGWDSLYLEDDLTLAYYGCADFDSDFPWKKGEFTGIIW